MQKIKKKVLIFKYSLRGEKDILSTYKPATNFFNIKFIFIIQPTFDIASEFLRNAIEYKQIQIHDCHNYY